MFLNRQFGKVTVTTDLYFVGRDLPEVFGLREFVGACPVPVPWPAEVCSFVNEQFGLAPFMDTVNSPG
jgi:hypothetical protein